MAQNVTNGTDFYIRWEPVQRDARCPQFSEEGYDL